MKQFKINAIGTLELNDKAEAIRFRDEEGNEWDAIKFQGKLYRPAIHWMEYSSSDLARKQLDNDLLTGIGFESISDEDYNKHFCNMEDESYLIEEI